MKKNYAEIVKIYICADIFGEELLVDIEGVAELVVTKYLF